MEVYVMCPFCNQVFDSLAKPHFTFRVDNRVRTAHVECFEAVMKHSASHSKMVPALPAPKPNGDGQEMQP